MSDRTPLLPFARLWEKTRGKGTTYMVGRLGLAKLVLFPVREEQSDGHTHELFITTPTAATQQGTAGRPRLPPRSRPDASRRPRPNGSEKTPIEDDPVPF
jgi:hypothetical protein